METREVESPMADSFIESTIDVRGGGGSIIEGGGAEGGDTLAQEMDQIHQSDIEILEKQATSMHELEKDIIDLNEIAVDLNREVVTQGKGIDRIELHTEKAASRVEKATKITDETVIMKRDNRTLLIIVLLVAGGVLLFIVVVIVVLAVVLGVVLA